MVEIAESGIFKEIDMNRHERRAQKARLDRCIKYQFKGVSGSKLLRKSIREYGVKEVLEARMKGETVDAK